MPEKKESNNWINLTKQLPDIEEHIQQGKINVVPLPAYKKKPEITDWNNRVYSLTETLHYKPNSGKPRTQKGLKYHKGNYGCIIGYNHKKYNKSIAVIDIDGYKLDKENPKFNEVKAYTQKYIYNCLKNIPNSLQVKTQSGGYHIYLWNITPEESKDITSKSLYFPKELPKDFKYKELAGVWLNDAIEIFTVPGRQTVLPSSTTKLKENNYKKRNYKVISKVNLFSEVDTVDDINQLVVDQLVNNGFGYKKYTGKTNTRNTTKKKNTNTNNNDNSNLKKLSKNKIRRVVDLTAPLFKIIPNEKHYTAKDLGGYFSNHITKGSSSQIANGIIKKVGKKFDSTVGFKNTVLKNYDRDTNKTGLPTLVNRTSENIEKRNNTKFNITEFVDELESICNNSFSKDNVGDLTINDNQVPIYLYENSKSKWLKYQSILKDTDLILDFKTRIAKFSNTRTGKEIISVEFDFKNNFFKLRNKDINLINSFLKTEELPKYFVESIRVSLNQLESYITTPKELSREETLKQLFITRTKENYARKELGNYLNERGTILRRGINKPYILNTNTNGYDSVEIDDILDFLNYTGDFEINTIHTDDIKIALGFIGERIKPEYNIVKFKNCLYDIKNFTVIETTEKPILTLTEVQYNYNPEAKGKLVVEFLESSLKQKDDTEEELQDRVIGVYEFIGYLLTSGNKKNAWFIISGIGGGGKGVLTRLIISIFGTDKVGDLKLQELTPDNKFATAHLESKQINIVRDSPKKPIEDTGMLKAITGYDDIGIEHKGKDKYILPKEEVPDMVTVCNNMPRFKEGFDESLLQRAIIFEFLNRFRGTDQQNENLEEDILNDPQEMEFLIYQSVQAYKDMVENKRDFRARIGEEKTRKLLSKHTDPISYILPKLVKYNKNAEEDGEDYITTEELNKLIVFIAKKEGVNITSLDKKGLIKSYTLLNAIRREFGFDKDYKTVPKGTSYNETTKKVEYNRVYPMLCKTYEYTDYLEQYQDSLEQEEEQQEE